MNADEFSKAALLIADELQAMTATARRVAEVAAEKIETKLQAEFKAGATPSGQAWQPLKDRSGRTPLDRTGRMEAKLQVVSDGLVVRGKLYAPANLHQYGTKRGLPARPMFPDPSQPLPESWEAALEEAGAEVLAEMTTEMQKHAK